MICALDIEDYQSTNMPVAEESRLVLEAKYSGHSEKNVSVSLWKTQKQTFKFGSFTNVKALFPVVWCGFFPDWFMSKVEKTV